MDIGNVFGGDSLKASDLQGTEPTVVISDVQLKKFDNGNKLVISFQGKKKTLVCNKTNANRIAYIHGNNTDDWIGREIVLFTDLVDFQGKTVEAIRVRPPARRAPAPQQRQQSQQQRPAPDDGFDTHQSGGATVMTKRPPQQQPKDGLEEILPDRKPIPF